MPRRAALAYAEILSPSAERPGEHIGANHRQHRRQPEPARAGGQNMHHETEGKQEEERTGKGEGRGEGKGEKSTKEGNEQVCM